jgi:enoyl-CoA hydratase/carnithine racemase
MTVSLDMRGDVGLITIDDGKKNVINHESLDELEEAWETSEAKHRPSLLTTNSTP